MAVVAVRRPLSRNLPVNDGPTPLIYKISKPGVGQGQKNPTVSGRAPMKKDSLRRSCPIIINIP